MKTLTKAQIKRQDAVDNSIFELLCKLNPAPKQLDWNIEMIGDVREQIRIWIVDRLKLTDEMKFYPYLKIKQN